MTRKGCEAGERGALERWSVEAHNLLKSPAKSGHEKGKELKPRASTRATQQTYGFGRFFFLEVLMAPNKRGQKNLIERFSGWDSEPDRRDLSGVWIGYLIGSGSG